MTVPAMAPAAAEADAATAASARSSMQADDAQPAAEKAAQNNGESNLRARAYQQDLVEVALENNVGLPCYSSLLHAMVWAVVCAQLLTSCTSDGTFKQGSL
jgi:hypothetical protein